jgi:hypothetical protein
MLIRVETMGINIRIFGMVGTMEINIRISGMGMVGTTEISVRISGISTSVLMMTSGFNFKDLF